MGNVPGWAPDDALHCRTRAVWDEEMIFISIAKIQSEYRSIEDPIVYASIRNYPNSTLNEGDIYLYWRIKGSNHWNKELMKEVANNYQWYARIPRKDKPTQIEYYVKVITKTGKLEKRPMTAPDGFFEFEFSL